MKGPQQFCQYQEFPLFEVQDSGFSTKTGRDLGLKVSAPATFNLQAAAISQTLNVGVLVFIYTGRKIDSSFKIIIHLIPFFKWYIDVVVNFLSQVIFILIFCFNFICIHNHTQKQ